MNSGKDAGVDYRSYTGHLKSKQQMPVWLSGLWRYARSSTSKRDGPAFDSQLRHSFLPYDVLAPTAASNPFLLLLDLHPAQDGLPGLL
jgi:hypothetical protein